MRVVSIYSMADKDLYYFKDFTKDERDKLAESGGALKDGSFPIQTAKDLTNAIQAVGRAADPAEAKAHIITRAKAIDKTDLLPTDWEGSTKKASEPGVGDVHVDGVPQPKGKKDKTQHYFNQLYSLIKAKVGSVLSSDDFNEAVRKARGHAGGRTKSEIRAAAKAAQMSEKSYSDIISMVNAELQSELGDDPFRTPNMKFWYAQEVFPDYAIVKDTEGGCFYQIPYTLSDDGDEIELGDPVEVEQTYTPMAASEHNLLDMCSDGKKFCLFNELPQEYTATPDRMPLLPIPGTYKHEKYGKVEITKERNQRFCDNINNAVYQANLPIDAEHELDLSGAFGYIKQASMNDDGSVDATNVEWTDRGKKAFDENRFKYGSPKWWDRWTDPMSEEKFSDVVIGYALTTRPFFKDKALKPLIASERGLEVSDAPKTAGKDIILHFTALTPDNTGVNMVTQSQIEAARRLVAAADAKAAREFAEGKSEDEITRARALVASEDARIAAEKAAKDPDGNGDDDTNAEGDTDGSHFDKATGKKKPEMFDAEGKPLAKKAAEPLPQEFSERVEAEVEKRTKQFREELDATKAQAKRANDRADAQEKANRIMRFTSMVRDWPGEAETNIGLLEHFATSCDGGEASKEFKDYVRIQSASATQLSEAGLFSEIGSSLGGAPDSPLGELEVKAAELMAGNPQKYSTKAQAFNEACSQNPKLYEAHRAAERRSAN